MTFPTIAASTTSSETTNTTTHTIAMPSGSGGRLITVVLVDERPSTWLVPDGWEFLDVGNSPGDDSCRSACYYRDSDPGAAVTFETSSSQCSAHRTWRITGFDTGTAPTLTLADGNSATPDPPVNDPAGWDVEDTLWLATMGIADATITMSSPPASYGNDGQVNSDGATDGVTLAWATRENAVASENPGTFAIGSSVQWVTYTIAVRPAAGPPPGPPIAVGLSSAPVTLPGPKHPKFGGGLVGPWVGVPGSPSVVFDVALGGTVSSSGTLVKAASNAPAGTVTSAGTLRKDVTNPDLVGTVTSGGALGKQTQKPLAGTVTSAGVLTAIKIVLMSFAGTVTSVGTLRKNVAKPPVGAVTSAGTVVKQDQKSLGGTQTSTGTLRKLDLKSFAGTVTPTGVLIGVKVVLRSFAGTVTSSGSLLRQVQKVVGGTLTSGGVLRRSITKSFGSTVTPVGTLGKFISRIFSGVVASVGTLTNLVPLAGSLQILVGKLRRRFGAGRLEGRYDADDLRRRYGTGDLTREP